MLVSLTGEGGLKAALAGLFRRNRAVEPIRF